MITKNRTNPSGSRFSQSLLALALSGSCALAQAPAVAPDEVELPPVITSASASDNFAIEEIGVSVSVLNVEDLKAEGIYTLSGAMQQVPGVYTVPGGGQTPGFSSIPNIRGTCAECYGLTTMDGMKLQSSNSELTGDVVSQTNLFNLGTLEVLRGSQAAIYGGGAVNGVIYMETPEGKGEPSYNIFAEAGSFNSYIGSLTAQGVVDKLAYFVNVGYASTSNDFTKTDGSSFDVKDLGKSEMWQESMRFDYRANDDNHTTITFRQQDSEFRALLVEDGVDGYQDYDKSNTLLTAKHQTTINDFYSTTLFAGYYRTDDSYGDQDVQLNNTEMRWENYLTWNKQHKTTVSFSWDRSDYYSNKEAEACCDDHDHDHDHDHAEAEVYDALENIYGFAINHNMKHGKNWDNNIALRLDSSTQFGEQFTFRFASNYRFNEEQTRAFASIGTGYKSPTQWQLSNTEFTTGSTTYVGNPDLEVETSISADIGIEHKLADKHKLTGTYFWTQYFDMLHHHEESGDDHSHEHSDDHDDDSVLMVQNAEGHALSQGIELSLQGEIEENWKTRYTLSFTYTQPKMNGVQYENSTRQLYSADINTSPTEKLTIGTGISAGVGRVNHHGEPTDNYLNMRLYAQYQVTEALKVHLRIENVLNQKYEIDPDTGILNSGPAIYGGFSYTF